MSNEYVLCERDGSILSMNVETGEQRETPCASYADSGWDHYAACIEDDAIAVIDLATGGTKRIASAERAVKFTENHVLELGYVGLLAFTPDGKGLISGEDDPMGPSSCGHGGIYRPSTGEALGDLGIICSDGSPATGGEWIVGWERRTLITKDLRRAPLGPMLAAVSPDGHLFSTAAT